MFFNFPPPQVFLSDKSFSPFDQDFLNYWTAARLALNHEVLAIFNVEDLLHAEKALTGYIPAGNNWSYPPHFLPLILGLGLVPYGAAFSSWIVLTFALYAMAVVYKRPEPWKLTAALALAPASFVNLQFGQNGFLTAACLVGGLRLLEKRPTLAGIAFGLMTVKPQLMLPLPIILIAGKHWRALVVTVLTSAALIAISLWLFGIEPWLAYVHNVIPFQTKLFEVPPIEDRYVLNASFVTLFTAARRWGASLALAYGLSIASFAAASAALLYACRKGTSADQRNMIAMTAVFLMTPYAHHYDMPILNAALISFFAVSRSMVLPLWQICVTAALFLFPVFCHDLNAAGFPVGPLIIGAFFVSSLALLNRRSRLLESA